MEQRTRRTRSAVPLVEVNKSYRAIDAECAVALSGLTWVCRGIAPEVHDAWMTSRAAALELFEFLRTHQPGDEHGLAAVRHWLATCALRLYPIHVRVECLRGRVTVGPAPTVEEGPAALVAPRFDDHEPKDVRPWIERHVLALDPFAQRVADPYLDLFTRDAWRIVDDRSKVRNDLARVRIVNAVRQIAFGGTMRPASFGRILRRARERDIESELHTPYVRARVVPLEPVDYHEIGDRLLTSKEFQPTVWIPPQAGRRT
jgi:hypothetical protein